MDPARTAYLLFGLTAAAALAAALAYFASTDEQQYALNEGCEVEALGTRMRSLLQARQFWAGQLAHLERELRSRETQEELQLLRSGSQRLMEDSFRDPRTYQPSAQTDKSKALDAPRREVVAQLRACRGPLARAAGGLSAASGE